jgi:hypothetical protein
MQISADLKKMGFMYIGWITIHYVAAHTYAQFCVPLSWYGFIASPLMVTAPHCQGLRWVVYNGGLTIANMWLVFGAWIGSQFLRP